MKYFLEGSVVPAISYIHSNKQILSILNSSSYRSRFSTYTRSIDLDIGIVNEREVELISDFELIEMQLNIRDNTVMYVYSMNYITLDVYLLTTINCTVRNNFLILERYKVHDNAHIIMWYDLLNLRRSRNGVAWIRLHKGRLSAPQRPRVGHATSQYCLVPIPVMR